MTKQAAKTDYRQILDRYVERRSSPRYPFTAAIEAFDIQANIRMAGRISDISKQGCYLDTISPFVKNATVTIAVTKNNQSFRAHANIVYSMTGMGMGLAFTTIEPDQLPVLEAWLETLRSEGPATQAAVSVTPSNATSPAEAETANQDTLRETVCELIVLLSRKNVVSDSESAALLRKLSE